MTVVLRLDRVWKAYPDWSATPRTLRGALAGRSPLVRRRGRRRWALQDVSLELGDGRSLGVIGPNGAGKSTLLRLASGIGRPTRGALTADPETASVLNLGVAFDDQLTGRENAFTTALVAGFTRARARAALPRMLEFSGLEDYVDSPVRTYSEGMRLRLAFSLLAVLEPRLLVLDEVLAVGDMGFRAQCADRIAELRNGGTSLVLASHASAEIVETCERALWLDHGRVRALGDAETVVAEYERAFHDAAMALTPVGAADETPGLRLGENRFGSQEAVVRDVRVQGDAADGRRGPVRLRSGQALKVAMTVAAPDGLRDPVLTLSLRRVADDAVLLDLASRSSGFTLGEQVREAQVEVQLERLDLPAGDYALDVGLYESEWERTYDYHHAAYPLRIEGPSGGKGQLAVPHAWRRIS